MAKKKKPDKNKAGKAAAKKKTGAAGEPSLLHGQQCPMCGKKTLTLMESDTEVPYLGKLSLFSMNCSECKYHKADVEAHQPQEPSKWTVEVQGKEDLKIRIVKSAEATVKIPHVGDVRPGPASNGYITNVEGLVNRFKKQVEKLKEEEEDPAARKKAKKLIKKLQKFLWGEEKLKIIIEDPTGNSAIVSDKAQKSKMKK